MDLAVRHLKTIGCEASGLLSDEDDLVKAVRSETRRHAYDEVILATGRQGGSSLARALRQDPVHQLRRHLGARLIVFPPGPAAPHRTPSA
jgi:20S proteasome alpha/beta subunit